MRYLLVILSFLFLSYEDASVSSNLRSTNCHQTFHFFFVAEGSPNFWIGQDFSGECNYSVLMNIDLNEDSPSVSKSPLENYKNWDSIRKLDKIFTTNNHYSFTEKDSILVYGSIKVSPPKNDTSVKKAFSEHISNGGSNAVSWLYEKGDEGIDAPIITGTESELIYSYKGGFYKNYSISNAIYISNSYLLIFTEQDQKAVGGDTMHGFFIYKIKN